MEFFEYLIIAFISSVILIFLSKVVMQKLLRRPADYYMEAELLQEELILNSAGISINEEIETDPEGELTGEHINVKPKISADEALAMHLIDEETAERFRKADEKEEKTK